MADEVTTGREPIPPARRRRLQMCFEHGTKSAAKNDFKYATDMFTTCVDGDPANAIYIKQFLVTLAKSYNDNKKGAGFTSKPKATALKGMIAKASYSKDWPALMKSGLEMLKLNPWDVGTLSSMASACDALNYDEAQLVYLKWALEVNSKDAEVNRLCGRALARLGRFDEAIACWHRVVQAKPGDDEATHAVADLAIEKTISHGGYEDAESSTEVKANRAAKEDFRSEAVAKLTPQQQLERAISKKPDDTSLYIELADLHTREERHKEAIDVLTRALEASGGDVMIRERLEDCQLRGARHQLEIAKKKAALDKTPQAQELVKRMKTELNSTEMEVFRTRSERYPNNPTWKFELGMRLKKAQKYNEAIKCFQAASGDAKRKADTHMELGECFHYIKQYKLAMKGYEDALEAVGSRDADLRKLGLYRAGKLALGLAEKYLSTQDSQGPAELDRAEKYLSELAGLEFGYQDVPQLLDKISKIRNKD
jgi:tetratricopeptide (TPR) repeat protein